jgi:hypothetical protein
MVSEVVGFYQSEQISGFNIALYSCITHYGDAPSGN